MLNPLPIPTQIWQDISMDFVEGLPQVQGKSVILVVVDRFSKAAHFLALSHPYTAVFVAQLFRNQVYKLHGMPKSIVSDRDPVFTSRFWQELFKQCKVKLKLSSAYHPQTDGQTEVVNRCLENFLRCLCIDQPKNWLSTLPLAEWWYNTSYHSSLQTTPFEVVYGHPPPIHTPYLAGDSNIEEVDRSLLTRESAIAQIKINLSKAQQRMNQLADKHRKEKVFMVGSWVYLKLIPYRQSTLGQHRNHKLVARYAGPFKILERVGPVAYKLQLPKQARIHDVLHVSCLKERCGSEEAVPILPGYLCGEEPEYLPEAILDRGIKKVNNKAVAAWLIKWRNRSIEEASWELASDFQKRFPNFNP